MKKEKIKADIRELKKRLNGGDLDLKHKDAETRRKRKNALYTLWRRQSKLLYRLASISCLLFASACASEKNFEHVLTPSFITKETAVAFQNRMEATPFLWNGKPYMMSSHRAIETTPNLSGEIEIFDENDALVSSTPSPIKFASALVVDNTLHVIGTHANRVLVTSTTDLVNWTEPRVMLESAASRTLYNTSVIKRADGTYLMALETCEPNTACFNVRFFATGDLDTGTWSEVGKIFSTSAYAACPTIREIDGVIYMIYLRDVGHYATYIARSTDLISWQHSPQVMLSALETNGEENNASDVDLIEHNGQVLINYAIGNQLTYSHIKRARYAGTLKDFLREFF